MINYEADVFSAFLGEIIINMNALISVIVPIYNVEDYLEKCISSIINKSYSNLEILLIDDGSTDDSCDICDKYEKKDNRIRVIHKSNEGLVRARKTGLMQANGKYIGFVDGDDYIDKEMFECLYSDIIKYDVDFVHTGFFKETRKISELINSESFVYEVINTEQRIGLLNICLLSPQKRHSLSASIWSKLYKLDFIKKVYSFVPDHQSYGEDVISLYVALSLCKKMMATDKAYYHQNVRDNSLSNVDGDKYFRNEVMLASSLIKVSEIVKPENNYKQFNTWIKNRMLWSIANASEIEKKYNIPQYYFRPIEMLRNKSIVIYGAGVVGKDFIYQIENENGIEIVGVVDKNYKTVKIGKYEIFSPESIISMDFDYVLIAVFSEENAADIENFLIDVGVNKDKILWHEPIV